MSSVLSELADKAKRVHLKMTLRHTVVDYYLDERWLGSDESGFQKLLEFLKHVETVRELIISKNYGVESGGNCYEHGHSFSAHVTILTEIEELCRLKGIELIHAGV